MPRTTPPTTAATAALVLLLATTLALQACSRQSEATGPAKTAFDALAAACTEFAAARSATVAPGPGEGQWTKTGFGPALVQAEVTRTESAATPYVGKIVVKDNVAQATAASQAEAEAITLTPEHLLANRTHTFIYSHDGAHWRWDNGVRLTKRPGHNDSTVALTAADAAAPGEGLAGCLPR